MFNCRSSKFSTSFLELRSPKVWELIPIGYNVSVLYQCKYELRVSKIEETKQRLVEVWQISDTVAEWENTTFMFPGFAG